MSVEDNASRKEAALPRHRYRVLDSYRFLAALGVVFYHFEGNLSPLRGHQTDVLDRFQTLVDFFFVLSGFVLMHTYGARIKSLSGYGDFLRKRIARIYPLQLATVLLCVAIAAFVAIRNVAVRDPALINLDLVPANLLLLQAWGTTAGPGLNFPSWSISAEWFVYLLFPVFAMLLCRVGPIRALVIAAASAMVIEAVRALLGLRPGYLATFDMGMLRAVPTFLAGMAVCRIVEARKPSPVSWMYPNLLAVLVILLMLVRAPFLVIVACYPLLVGLIATADRGGRPTMLASSFFVKLGDASFAIYMLHTFVEIACVGLARKLGWTSVPALFGVAAGGILVIVALGLLSFRYFETPCRLVIAGGRRKVQPRLPADPLPAGGR